ncbi:MAG: hypothetical protein WC284_16590, partial [Candidimonas sp.]
TGEGVAVGPSVPLPPDPATGISVTLRQTLEIIPTTGVVAGQIIGRFLDSNPLNPTSPHREWESVGLAHSRCAYHQGNGVPSFIDSTTFNQGEVVYAETGGSNDPNHPSGTDQDYPSLLTSLVSNRSSYSIASMTTNNLVSYSNSVFFTNSLEWIVSISATTQDHLRFFFNSGGGLTISPTLLSSGNPQSNSWQSTLSGLTTTIDYNVFWNNLTTSYLTLATANGVGVYSTNSGIIQARLIGTPNGFRGNRGNGIQIRIFLNDSHFNMYEDYASGTFGVNVAQRRATNFVSIPTLTSNTPTISTS